MAKKWKYAALCGACIGGIYLSTKGSITQSDLPKKDHKNSPIFPSSDIPKILKRENGSGLASNHIESPIHLEAIVLTALKEGWPNAELRALIAMTRDHRLMAALWARNSLDASDFCVLALFSGSLEEKMRAAALWAQADPENSEPRYRLLLERWQKSSDKAAIMEEIDKITKLPKLELYYAQRALEYDVMLTRERLSDQKEISPFNATDTKSKATNFLNLLGVYSASVPSGDLDRKEQIASLCAAVARQVQAKEGMTFAEYQSALTAEFNTLKQLNDETEYGSADVTVADRKAQIAQLSEDNMRIQDVCNEAFARDSNLARIFLQRQQALGEYLAYKQLYATLKQATPSK